MMQFSTGRQAMTWLHTWLGLIFGFILMVCFFFGSLSVFDREIDRWAIPETRFDPQLMPSFDEMLIHSFEAIQPDKQEYEANMPEFHNFDAGPMTPRSELPMDELWAYTTHRDPVLRMGVGFRVPEPKEVDGHNHIHGETTINPLTGQSISDQQLKIGSDWFYPLHYSLNLNWKNIGIYIVGLAAFMMLVALVTGVIIHRKIFKEFFTFRRSKNAQRNTLDLHNMTGVLAMPFHFFFALTGLIIFAGFYFVPSSHTVLEPLHEKHEALDAESKGLPHGRTGVAAPVASVDAMVEDAKKRWAARGMPGQVGFLMIQNYGDENGYVSLYRAGSDRVALVGQAIHYKLSTGALLYEEPANSAVESIAEFLTGLHLQHFEHWMLRWLYVIGGLMGCACIATGFVFFIQKRAKKHAQVNTSGAAIVDALAVVMVPGMVLASVAMLLANRLLSADLSFKGDYEKYVFCGAWLLSFAHAVWRSKINSTLELNPAWREQCFAVALVALMAVLANWVTTGDHLIQTLFVEPYYAVAGVDAMLVLTSVVGFLVAQCLRVVGTEKQKLEQGRFVYE